MPSPASHAPWRRTSTTSTTSKADQQGPTLGFPAPIPPYREPHAMPYPLNSPRLARKRPSKSPLTHSAQTTSTKLALFVRFFSISTPLPQPLQPPALDPSPRRLARLKILHSSPISAVSPK